MKSSLHANFLLVFSVLIPTLCLASCGGGVPNHLALDSNPVFTGGTGWVVVIEAYARVKAEPSEKAPDIGHLRGGDTLAVLGRERFPPETGVWYKVKAEGKDGWIQSQQTAFFEVKEMAERAASRYR